MNFSQAEYNQAIFTLRNLLNVDSAPGTEEDLEAMRLARFIEDYEAARGTQTTFEPYYIDSTQ